ncbi:hypothetical protein QBC38DRAFT_458949 [Podospora fimiseda]|uniref:Uncharacterized protein n=1 Tax=Podospora fimiseda TaxID=252190 RepID=A0AAN7BIB6_9PEZI|nr:hypothetical protein QBC38DRAFT_458949 [Podospora fimiseda]
MASNEIITIINNSGKVISTGKQLVNIFKEAQAAYREKKDAVKAERAARAGIKRAQTFDVARSAASAAGTSDLNNNKGGNEYVLDDRRALPDIPNRRKSLEDGDDSRSHISSRSSGRRSSQPRNAPLALTEGNLKTLSVVSSAAPSKAPSGFKYPDPSIVSPSVYDSPPPGPGHLVRHRTEPILPKKKKSIDMGLAYGDIPPDLADRHDLGPINGTSPTRDRAGQFQAFRSNSSPRSSQDDLVDVNSDEAEALGLMDKIEDFLEEAHCVHHSATNMIASLQERPEAAAAVALSLAELSALIGKMSPAFLAFIKGGSPAVFALLASPQFLIGTGIAAGVTVIMFGGWKIVKRMVDNATGGGSRQMEAPIAMRAMPVPGQAHTVVSESDVKQLAAPTQVDAFALENVEELSSVERWRRGIQPEFGIGTDDDQTPDEVDMLTKEAERALKLEKDRFLSRFDEEVDPDDSVSQIGVRARSYRTYKSYRSRHSSSRKHRDEDVDSRVPERRSSRRKDDDNSSRVSDKSSSRRRDDDGESRVSERGHRSHRSDREREREKERERRDHKDKDDDVSVAGSERSSSSRSHRGERRDREKEKDRDGDDGASVASSERSYRSTRSSRSHRGDKDYDDKSIVSRSSKHGGPRVGVKAIPEEEEEKDDAKDKPKKANMLKQLFKGKLKDYIKEEREKASSASSVMV